MPTRTRRPAGRHRDRRCRSGGGAGHGAAPRGARVGRAPGVAVASPTRRSSRTTACSTSTRTAACGSCSSPDGWRPASTATRSARRRTVSPRAADRPRRQPAARRAAGDGSRVGGRVGRSGVDRRSGGSVAAHAAPHPAGPARGGSRSRSRCRSRRRRGDRPTGPRRDGGGLHVHRLGARRRADALADVPAARRRRRARRLRHVGGRSCRRRPRRSTGRRRAVAASWLASPPPSPSSAPPAGITTWRRRRPWSTPCATATTVEPTCGRGGPTTPTRYRVTSGGGRSTGTWPSSGGRRRAAGRRCRRRRRGTRARFDDAGPCRSSSAPGSTLAVTGPAAAGGAPGDPRSSSPRGSVRPTGGSCVVVDDTAAWDWAAWLPHGPGGHAVVTGADDADALAAALTTLDDGDPRHVVVVTDRPDLLGPAHRRAAPVPRRHTVRGRGRARGRRRRRAGDVPQRPRDRLDRPCPLAPGRLNRRRRGTPTVHVAGAGRSPTRATWRGRWPGCAIRRTRRAATDALARSVTLGALCERPRRRTDRRRHRHRRGGGGPADRIRRRRRPSGWPPTASSRSISSGTDRTPSSPARPGRARASCCGRSSCRWRHDSAPTTSRSCSSTTRAGRRSTPAPSCPTPSAW